MRISAHNTLRRLLAPAAAVVALMLALVALPGLADATTVTCSTGQTTLVSNNLTNFVNVGFTKSLANDANLRYLQYSVTQSEPLSLSADGHWEGDGCLLVNGLSLLPRAVAANRVYFIRLTAVEMDGSTSTSRCVVAVAKSAVAADIAAAQAAATAAFNNNVPLPYKTCIDGFSDKRDTLPDLAQHENVTLNNDPGLGGAVVFYTPPVFVQTCVGKVILTTIPNSGTFFNCGTTPVVCTATDATGASATMTFNVTVHDVENPVLSLHADVTANATDVNGTVVTYTAPTATDNCPGVVVTCVPASGSVFPIGQTTVTCTARDASNRTVSNTFKVTVNQIAQLTIATRANIVQANDLNQAGASVTFTPPTATGTGVTVTCVPASGTFFPVGVTTVTCTAKDVTNATVSSTFTVTVNDTQAPTIAMHANMTVGNDLDQAGAVVGFMAPAASDNCPGVTVTCAPISGSFFPVGVTTVTCTAKDAANNLATSTFTVTVNDVQAPTITVHADISVGNDLDQNGAMVAFSAPAASDNCPGVTVTCVPASGSFFALGTTTVSCTAKDAADNTAQSTFTVTVSDTQSPVIATHPDMVMPNDLDQAGAMVTFTAPAASDNAPGVTVACSPVSGSFFPVGSTLVVCTAQDAAGAVASSTFIITVDDVQAPSIGVHADISAPNDLDQAGAVVSYVAPAASDNCPGVSVTCVPASGSFFAVGSTVVTCTALDAHGNVASSNFTVVVRDTQLPAIGVNGNLVLPTDLDRDGAVVVFDAPAVSDNCAGVSVTCAPASGSFFAVGTTVVTCTALDASGNTSSSSFSVSVHDIQAPSIAVHADITVGTDFDMAGAVVSFDAPAASDNCPGVAVTCVPMSGAFFPVGSTLVTCTARDAAGNASSSTFPVVVNDTQNPSIATHADMTVANDLDQAGAVVSYAAPGAVDNCPGVVVTCVPASGSFFAVGATVVTCTAHDAAGHSASSTFTVTVNDTQKPAIATHANISVPTDNGIAGAAVSFDAPSATDNCPGVTVSCAPASGSLFALGVTTVTCTARDAAGNTATSTFTVTVTDKQKPHASVSVATTQLWSPNNKLVDVGLSYDACDACGACKVAFSVTQDEDLSSTGKDRYGADAILVKDASGKVTGLQLRATRDAKLDGRTYLILLTVTDGAGNSSTAACTVVVPKSQSPANANSAQQQATAAQSGMQPLAVDSTEFVVMTSGKG